MNEQDSNAFEFVLGTLPPKERTALIARLKADPQLAADVRFWEEQLIALNHTEQVLAPWPQTWQNIDTRIRQRAEVKNKTKPGWLTWLPWGLSLAMSLALVITLNLGTFRATEVPVDYVAVLTDESGAAKLTAVTEGDTQNMWLQWGEVTLNPNQDLQLWALSKSDQQIRSIAVVSNEAVGKQVAGKQGGGKQETQNLPLSEANWRLIKDSASLILTIEEKGGSVLDEPSAMIVAKGICVRLNRKDKTS